jgi:hypothetical protein
MEAGTGFNGLCITSHPTSVPYLRLSFQTRMESYQMVVDIWKIAGKN